MSHINQEAASSVACKHYNGSTKTLHMILSSVLSNEQVPCGLCPNLAPKKSLSVKGKSRPKDKGKAKSEKGQAKSGKIMVCLHCGKHFCAIGGDLTKAHVHCGTHAKNTKHWWFVEFENPVVGYCFACPRELTIATDESETYVNGQLILDPFRISSESDNLVVGMSERIGTCFNSVIQSLLAIRMLRVLMISAPRTGQCTIALKKLFLKTALDGTSAIISTDKLFAQFTAHQMQDCDLFFCSILDELCGEEAVARKIPKYAMFAEYPTIKSIFSGQVSTTVWSTSGCHHTELEYEDFCIISLSKTFIGAAVNVQQGVSLYTEPEQVPQWTCQRCAEMASGMTDSAQDIKEGDNVLPGLAAEQRKDFRAAKRIKRIVNAPPILVVSCKGLGQDHSEVLIEEGLDIGPFMDLKRSKESQSTNYILIGAITCSKGYYTAYVKAKKHVLQLSSFFSWIHSKEDTWVSVKDGEVCGLRIFKIPTEEEACLLFYQRVEEPAVLSSEIATDGDSIQGQDRDIVIKQEPDDIQYMSSDKTEQENDVVTEMDNKEREGESKLLEEKESTALCNVVKGMQNLGNSCFFNAVMQNLLALDLMRNRMLDPSNWIGDLTIELKNLFLKTSSSNDVGDALDPKNLFESICSKHERFRGFGMQDSHELLSFFLEDLHIEEVHARKLADSAPTIVNSVFCGELCSTVRSRECKHGSITHDSMRNISLTIPSNDADDIDSISVEDCLAEFVRAETVTDWACSYCPGEPKENKRIATRKLLISKAPPVLVIHFRRLIYEDGKHHKQDRHVTFAEVLDVREFMILEKRHDENEITTYRLVGVVQHGGDAVGGHFVAFVRAGCSDTKSWFRASDTMVTESSLSDVLSCQAYMLFYEKTDAPYTWQAPLVQNPLPDPWIKKCRKRTEQVKAVGDARLAQKLEIFLNSFTLPGENMPYYHSQLIAMIERGFRSRELNILYSHLVGHSKDMAIELSNTYHRLRGDCLEETAKNFMKQAYPCIEKLLSEKAKKLVTSESVLKFTFHGVPKRHEVLEHCLEGDMVNPVDVYGVEEPVMIPLPHKCAMVQKILTHFVTNHRNFMSWSGKLQPGDVDILDENVDITKSPDLIEPEHKMSDKMILAMELDFGWVANHILKKFKYSKRIVPFLKSFISFLSDMKKYCEWWRVPALAEALRDLIIHHPFLKPSMARANLLSGIHAGSRSFDKFDYTVAIKSILDTNSSTWSSIASELNNPVLNDVFLYKDKKKSPNDNTPIIDGKEQSYYCGEYRFLVEYLRNVNHHGSVSSLEKIEEDKPRRQMMKTLDETELAGAVHLEEHVMDALIALLRGSAFKGFLDSVWECYKKCNHSLEERPKST